MGSRKALFFDVDGTLLGKFSGGIPQSAKEAIGKARRMGHLAFVNSGRTSRLLDPIREQIELDGYLCGCGTHIMLGEKELYAKAIPQDTASRIKKALRDCRMEGVLEGKDGCHFTREKSWIPQLERMREDIGKMGCIAPGFLEDEGYEFDKFCCVTASLSDIGEFTKRLEAEFQIIDRGHNFWECVPAGHSKATAIQMVLEHYGIDLEEAYVFGDSTNDLSMFTYAKNAVLMGDHDKELEPYATFVTKKVEEDGVAFAMERLGIIG